MNALGNKLISTVKGLKMRKEGNSFHLLKNKKSRYMKKFCKKP